jgi:hypothetical protein
MNPEPETPITFYVVGNRRIMEWEPFLPHFPVPIQLKKINVDGKSIKEISQTLFSTKIVMEDLGESVTEDLREKWREIWKKKRREKGEKREMEEQESRPDVLFVYLGEKEIEEKIPVVTILKDTEECLKRIQNQYPECLVVYLPLIKCPRWKPMVLRSMDALFFEVRNFSKWSRSGKNGVSRIQCIDLNGVLKRESEFFEEDGFSLNFRGYEKINECLTQQLC